MAPALGLLVLAAACGSHQSVSVTLATLVADQDTYQGKEVTTQGMVRRFTDPSGPYFVIEDSRQDRVEVLPASRVARYDGKRVEVTGTFGFDETIGRFIRATRISRASG